MATSSTGVAKKKPIQFYPALDIVLLRELVAKKERVEDITVSEWDKIHKSVSDALPSDRLVTLRQVKDRTKLLVKKHKEEELASLKASGTEEEFDERKNLLTEYIEVEEERVAAKRMNKTKKQDEEKENQGRYLREKAMEALNSDMPKLEREDCDSSAEEEEKPKKSTPNPKPNKRADYLEFMKMKFEEDSKLRREELKLQRDRMDAERQQMLELLRILGQATAGNMKNKNENEE